MKLLDASGLKHDMFVRVDDDNPLSALAATPHAILLPLTHLAQEGESLLKQGSRLGVIVPNTVKVQELEGWLPRLSLIAVSFPSFSDGRGFSIARLLRRAGFQGTLRASGPLIADEFAYVLACDFDEVEVPKALFERQPITQWLEARSSITLGYQRGYATMGNILEQRRAARLQQEQ